MAIKEAEKIWFDGEFVDWREAKIHVLSHVVHYGSSVFEGIRCYDTKKGPACFRLRDHIDRLLGSAKIYRMESPYTKEQLVEAALETVRINGLRECYIRPIIFRGYGSIGVDPTDCPVHTVIAAWEWGKYLGPEALERGIDVCTSSWSRAAPNTFPTLAKAGGNYLNSQLVKMEARVDGYAEGIALDSFGYVSEGSGENVFMVKNGAIFTPPSSAAILPGVTRHSVIVLARDLGFKVRQQPIPREALYIADEVFFTGTAAEITPVRSIDKIVIGDGRRGPITQRLQEEFFALLSAEKEDRYGWLTFVYR